MVDSLSWAAVSHPSFNIRFTIRILLSLTILLGANLIQAQNVQWASRLLGFSSQAEKREYSAKQILGAPNKLPARGDSQVAWSPGSDSYSSAPYIKVGFRKQQPVRQILIAQNMNPGAIDRIYLYDDKNREYLVYDDSEQNKPMSLGKMRHIFIELTTYKVKALKITMKASENLTDDQIDAVGISNSEDSISTAISLTSSVHFAGEVEPLNADINSSFSEIMPRISPDGQILYFCRKDHPANFGGTENDDIWYARMEDDDWGRVYNIGPVLNNEHHNYVCGISKDGLITLGNQYLPGGRSYPGVSQSYQSGGKWAKPLNMQIEELTIYNSNAEYYMAEDRHHMIIAMKSWDNIGDKDLYLTTSTDQIHWSKPRHLGSTINSAAREMAPWLNAEGTALFFSSNGFSGYGDQDIFVSFRLDDSWLNWSEPQNLGSKINSAAWDSYFSYSPVSGQAYFASTRENPTNENIYRLAITEVNPPEIQPVSEVEPILWYETTSGLAGTHRLKKSKNITDKSSHSTTTAATKTESIPKSLHLIGRITDSETELPVSANVELIYDNNKYNSSHIQGGETNYNFPISSAQSFKIRVTAPGYFMSETELIAAYLPSQGKVRRDFKLIPVREGQLIKLENIYFDVNSAVIKKESYSVLDKYAAMLRSQPGIELEVQGHTNDRCSENYCVELSRKRANAVADYLAGQGVSAQIMTFKGFGSQHPVRSNKTAEGRKENQRVEIRIMKVD